MLLKSILRRLKIQKEKNILCVWLKLNIECLKTVKQLFKFK